MVVLFQRAEFDFFLLADFDFDLDFEAPFYFAGLAVADPLTGANFDVLRLFKEGFQVGLLFGLVEL